MNKKNERVILEVPYTEKDKVKNLGAWWDPEIKKWFVPNGKDSSQFKKWIDQKQ